MSTIIVILLTILALVALFFVAAIFARKEFTVQRELAINMPHQDVFHFIRYLSNHQAFSKWTTQDPAKETHTRGIDGTEGYVQGWDNFRDKAGIGELEIKKIKEGTRLDLQHRYLKPIRGLANASIITEPLPGNQTKVKWVYTGLSAYPMNLLTALLDMNKIVGKDLENGLQRLKAVLEN